VYADGDFEKAITTAVANGWDTDCNGATVGSVMGALLGASNLPAKWIRPLNDTLYSAIPDFHPIPISACAARSCAVYERLHLS
jgi:ADP-ribosylglycohydrolase